ncbi:MAG: HU family DNA-binding protein [Calditrichaeota bacterium]|nr:HU family DNA-binding protein [Calditrichota bacterium]MCB9391642.1 HU family DNA-binding protein [Calditrichota bacterium]
MGRTVTKQELVDRIADGIGLTRVETQAVVDGFLALVMDAVSSGDRVELRRFGIWKPVKRKGRSVRTPDGKHEVDIPDRMVAVFAPADEFKDRMSKP